MLPGATLKLYFKNVIVLNFKEYVKLTLSGRSFHMSQRYSKQFHLQKCSNVKLCTSILVNDGTLRSTADFASTLSNVNNVTMSDLLEILVMLLFSSHCFHPKMIFRKLQDYENIRGGDCFLIT